MKKFIWAVLVILLAGPVLIFLTQKKSSVPPSFHSPEKLESLAAQPLPLPAPTVQATEKPLAQNDPEPSLQEGELKSYILDRSALPDKRRQVLQQLVEKGPAGLAEIAAIAQAPVPSFPGFQDPHSSDAGYYTFEKGLRITAIEALDQWAVRGTDVMKELKLIRDTQNEKDLIFLASLAVAGIQEGRPGKVTRFIDQAFNEALNGK